MSKQVCLFILAQSMMGRALSRSDPQSETSTAVVYYTAGWADPYVTRTGAFDLAAAEIDVKTGAVHSHWNVTNVRDIAMGYLTVSPDGSEAIVARQPSMQDDVELFRVQLKAGQSQPLITAAAQQSLLKLCQATNFTCTDVSTFSASYDTDGSGKILFSFRLWTSLGYAIGNEAVAILHPDSSVQALTYKATGLGTNNTSSIDSCGRFVPGSNGSLVLFARQGPKGDIPLMVHNARTGSTSPLPAAPARNELLPNFCPQFIPAADGSLTQHFSYMTGSDYTTNANMTECTLTSDGSVSSCSVYRSFPIVDAGSKGTLPTAFGCTPLGPSENGLGPVLLCQNVESQLSVVPSSDPGTWTNVTLPYTDTVHKWCITSDCFAVHPARQPEGLSGLVMNAEEVLV